MARVMILRADKKRKVTLNLSIGADALLSALAKMRGTDRSTEVERLIMAGRGDVSITRAGKDYVASAEPQPDAA